jgi:hypothetical protein
MNKDNKSFDTALIRDLAVLLDETNLSEIELEKGDTRIRVARQISMTRSRWNSASRSSSSSKGRSGHVLQNPHCQPR